MKMTQELRPNYRFVVSILGNGGERESFEAKYPGLWDYATEVARALRSCGFLPITGGLDGTMQAASKGGAIGITNRFFENIPNLGNGPRLMVSRLDDVGFSSIDCGTETEMEAIQARLALDEDARRRMEVFLRAAFLVGPTVDAMIVGPGELGTLAEKGCIPWAAKFCGDRPVWFDESHREWFDREVRPLLKADAADNYRWFDYRETPVRDLIGEIVREVQNFYPSR